MTETNGRHPHGASSAPIGARAMLAGLLIRGTVRLIGYAIAWALVLGVIFAACSAAASWANGGPAAPPRVTAAPLLELVAPSATPAPTRAPKPKPTKRPHATPRTTPAPLVYDCGGADPADPAIDPVYDCEVIP